MSCGVGCRLGSDPALLWLWRRLAATAPIGPLAWEAPYAAGAAQEMAKKKKKKQTTTMTSANRRVEVGKQVRGTSLSFDLRATLARRDGCKNTPGPAEVLTHYTLRSIWIHPRCCGGNCSTPPQTFRSMRQSTSGRDPTLLRPNRCDWQSPVGCLESNYTSHQPLEFTSSYLDSCQPVTETWSQLSVF